MKVTIPGCAQEITQNYGLEILHKGLIANLILLNQAYLMMDVKSDLMEGISLLALTSSCKKITMDPGNYEISNLFFKVSRFQ